MPTFLANSHRNKTEETELRREENTFHFRADPSVLAETLLTPVSEQLLTNQMKTMTQSPVSYSK